MRQIVSFGGGGFSMEAGNPLLDEFVLDLTGKPRPKVCFLPSASGDADHYLVRFYRHFAAQRCEPSPPVAVSPRARAGRAPRAPARPGPDLRRRRQRHQPDRGLAGARDRRDPARVLGARRRPLRALGRLAVLVRRGRLDLPRPRRSASRGSASCRGRNTVHYSSEPKRREALLGWLREGMAPAYAADDGAALHFVGDEVAQVVASRPGARAYRVELRHGHVVTTQLATRYLGDERVRAAGRDPCPRSPRPEVEALSREPAGARRGRSSPSAGTSSRASAATRRSATTCWRSPTAPAAARLPAADRQRRPGRADRRLSRPASASRAASSRTCRCFGSRPRRSTSSGHLLAQDLIYVGGGSMLNLLAIWRAHGIDEILRECWERGIVLAGQSAGAMCWFECGRDPLGGRGAAGAGPRPRSRASLSVHYHRDPERRRALLDEVAGRRRRGYGIDDGAGVLIRGREVDRGRSAPATAPPPGGSTPDGRGRAREVRDAPRRPLPSPRPAIDEVPDAVAELRRLRRAGSSRGAWSRR